MNISKINQAVKTATDSIIKIFKKATNYLIVAATTFAATTSFSTKSEAANLITADGIVVTAGDNNGTGGGATDITAADVLIFTHEAATVNTEAAAMTLGALQSTTAASVVALIGTGALTITNTLTSAAALQIVHAAGSHLIVSGAITETAAIINTLVGTAQLTLAGSSKTTAGDIGTSIDGNGVLNLSGTITQSGTVGTTNLGIGEVNISGASTVSGVLFSDDVNITASADFSAASNFNTLDVTGANVTMTLGGATLVDSGTTSIIKMNTATNTVIVDGAVAIGSTITTAATSGGKVNVTGDGATLVKNVGTAAKKLLSLTATNNTITQGNVYADTTSIANTKTLSFTGAVASVKIGSAIDGAAAGQGTLVTNNTNAAHMEFLEDIGRTANLAAVTVTDDAIFSGDIDATATTVASGKIATFKKDIETGAGDLTITGVAIFSGTVAQTIVGSASGALVDGAGDLTISNSSGVTFGTNAIISGGTAMDVIISGSSAKAILTQGANAAKEVAIAATGIMVIDDTIAADATVWTTTTAQDNASTPAGSIIQLPSNLTSGEEITLFATVKLSGGIAGTVDATTLATVDAALLDNAFIDYSAAASSDDIKVQAAQRTSTQAAATLGVTIDQATAAANVITVLQAESATNLDLTTNLLNQTGSRTTADLTALSQQAAPQADTSSGAVAGTKGMTGSVQSIVSNRMASLRSGDAYVAGMSSGNGMSAQSGFIQAFGSEVTQKNTKEGAATVSGYDTDTTGVALGFDGITDDGVTLGLAASYSTTDVAGKGIGKSKEAIDSYTVSAYADKATDFGYIEGSLTHGINDHAGSRLVNSAGLDRSYKSAYDSTQTSLKVTAGSPQEVMPGTFVTPFGSLAGTIIKTDKYTETSSLANDNLRLKVEANEVTSVVGSVGLKAHMVSNYGTPMISLAVNNEMGDTKIINNNTYTGGGAKFKTSTDVEELSATLGIGYSYGNDMTSVNIGYEAEANDDDYLSHFGSIKIVAKF